MYQSIVILSGAGISAESGLKTFRGEDGVWETHRAEELATPEAFAANPALVHRFYNQRRAQLLSGEILPNPAHQALADLEKAFKGSFTLITQNVDNLHELAGNEQVLHMHGELLRVACMACAAEFDTSEDIHVDTRCSECEQRECLRPAVVWFGEMPQHMEAISQALADCDVFIAIGTSGTVYPAAGFVELVPPGARTLEVNLEPSEVQSRFAEHIYGKAGEVLPSLVEDLLQQCKTNS